MSRVFGVTSTGGYGILQELTEGSTAEKAQARGTTGKVEAEIAYSVTRTASARGIFNGTGPGTAGTALTIGSLSGLITDAGITESNTGYKEVNAAIEKADNSSQTGYSS